MVCLLTLIFGILSGCTERPRSSGGAPLATEAPAKARKVAEPTAQPKPGGEAPPEKQSPLPTPQPVPQGVPTEYAEVSTRFGELELHDLGPAAPVTATARGIVFITRRDEMIIARRKGVSGFEPVLRPKSDFAKYGRGPSTSDIHAYWASESGRLMQGDLKTGAVRAVFDRARAATRTSVVTREGRDLVAFVAQIEGEPLAYLWASAAVNGAEVLQISPDGSNATSLEIVPASPHPLVIVLEGRTSMSPVHVRRVRVTARRVTLEPDEVVWVGPGSHQLTEIHAIDTPTGDAAAFLPTAKDFRDFGMAQLQINAEGGEAPEPRWQIFPNGLDPAPVATAHLCGKQYVLFARPTEQRPRSPQELHLAELSGPVPSSGDLIARSRAFNDVSLAAVPGGAIAAWTADRRTWGVFLSCPG